MKFGQVYSHGAITPEAVVQRAVDSRLIHVAKFDTLVGTGLSGSLVIPMLARRLRRKWAIVRKENERRHSSFRIEGEIGERWIFVDDLISTGATLKRVQRAVEDDWRIYQPQHATTYVGYWLYADGGRWRAA